MVDARSVCPAILCFDPQENIDAPREIRRHVTELTDRSAVLSAIAEYDQLGQERFLRKYERGKSTRYILRYEGRDYDSKAIAAVAFGMQHKTTPLGVS